VARRLGVPCLAGALCRVHREQSQTGLRVGARQANVDQAFRPGPEAVRGRVLLVDDVFSTGATVAACARVLKSRGSQRVWVITLARAVLRRDADRAVSAAPRGSGGPA
jgi:predicted amidophosphoribosyltransferase